MPFEPVVLIPPVLCDARVFADQIGVLSIDHPVVVAPARGQDTIGEMAQSVLDVSPPNFAVCGAGLGGMVALEIIQRAPERVSRIALINTVAQADTPATASDRETQIIAAKSGRFDDVVAHELDTARLHADADTGAIAPLLRRMAMGIGPDAYIGATRALQKRKDQQGVLRKIRQPALVICGDSDPQTPVRRQEFIAEMIPYAAHEVIENAGFLPMLEQPDAVSAVLKAWVAQPLVLR
ncbi:MAG: alpha/beta fold hydrolase [Pseudomonadota bacterium]